MPSTSVPEKIAIIDAKSEAAHKRLDRTEAIIADQIKALERNFAVVASDVKDLVAMANKAKGWLAASMLFGSIVGALAMKVLSKWIA